MATAILAVGAAAVAAAGLLLVLRGRRAGRATDLVGSQLAATRSAAPVLSNVDEPAVRQQIETLLRQNRKIPAIKLVRERYPMSLRDAKALVERIEAGLATGAPAAAWPPGAAGTDPLSGYGGPAGALDPAVLAQVRDLKRRNQAIQAIRLLRQHTGMSLREAKDAVDRM